MLKEVVKPLSYHMPADKICEKLKKQDAQICELQYGEWEINMWSQHANKVVSDSPRLEDIPIGLLIVNSPTGK